MTMVQRTLEQHLAADAAPKRILALDGGGVRGIVSLAFLQRIETLLGERSGAGDDFRLCHYFDLIGGTSTGAIIAAALARGRTVKSVAEVYHALGRDIFKKSWYRVGLLRPKFPRRALDAALQKEFGADTQLKDPSIKTGLMVMLKRMDTSSPWPISNNPSGKYFASTKGDHVPNGEYLLWKLVRASTAAPHYFDPETLAVSWKGDQKNLGRFVDGGVSTANNPSLQLFMLATLKGHRLCWPTGKDKLLIVSVGTALASSDRSRPAWWAGLAAGHAIEALKSIMDDCNAQVETMMQWLSESPTARHIDAEIGDLDCDVLGGAPALSYLRYNVQLERRWMEENLGRQLEPAALRSLAEMDNPENMTLLSGLAEAAAQRLVKPEHFPTAFDV